MKNLLLVILLSMFSLQPSFSQETLKLWPDGVPGPNVSPKPEEVFDSVRVRYVSEPTLTVYLPEKEKNSGTAVVICPGGGYWIEAMDHEGYDFAKYLQERGIAGIVLKYRLPYGHPTIPLQDAQHAIRTVRANAKKWGIDPNKVGIAGFSAGGHLASTAETHFDAGKPDASNPIARESCRPDFAILGYPVITMNKDWTHMGSRENLLGKNPSKELVKKYSNELQVTPQTPPTFIFLADDDDVVPPKNSIEFYMALRKNHIPAELHIFSEGGHGFGMHVSGKPHDQWRNLVIDWMCVRKLIP